MTDVGMQKIGELADSGYSFEDLLTMKDKFSSAEIINLSIENSPAAYLLVNGFPVDLLKKELLSLEWDTKAKMYGRVVNKKARYNLCFADISQDPDCWKRKDS